MTPRRMPPDSVIARRVEARSARRAPLAALLLQHAPLAAAGLCSLVLPFLIVASAPQTVCGCSIFPKGWAGEGVAVRAVVPHDAHGRRIVISPATVFVELWQDGTHDITVRNGPVAYRARGSAGSLRDHACAARWLSERVTPARVWVEDGRRVGDMISALDALAVAGFARPGVELFPPKQPAAERAQPFPRELISSCRAARALVGTIKHKGVIPWPSH
ncbi:MAG: hypothetical protein KC503_36250 [Myxococcales bacterium]|nr:hypothetical protein [Myxococcales bacterium]